MFNGLGSNKIGITAVTVTYGDRWKYLEILLSRLEEEELVCNVIVVDNASKYDISAACEKAGFSKAQVKSQTKNLGSAGGYKIGIECALILANDYIMLYDDDVVSSPGSLNKLLSVFNKLTENRSLDAVAVLAFRESQHGRIILHESPLILADHHFLGLNIFNFIQRKFGSRGRQVTDSTPEVARQNRGVAYAGLFFHKSLIKSIGLPNADFVVYYDDVEFTSRLLKRGGDIWLDIEARCEDICQNYSMGVVELPFLGYLFADNEAKVFYLVRNRIYFDRYGMGVRSLYCLVNMATFLVILLIVGASLLRFKRLKIILTAIADGYSGKLGFHRSFPLS